MKVCGYTLHFKYFARLGMHRFAEKQEEHFSHLLKCGAVCIWLSKVAQLIADSCLQRKWRDVHYDEFSNTTASVHMSNS